MAEGPTSAAASAAAARAGFAATETPMEVCVSAQPKLQEALRGIVQPVGDSLGNIFGFQAAASESGDGAIRPKAVPSNVANQVDHLCALLATEMDRYLDVEGGNFEWRLQVTTRRPATPHSTSTTATTTSPSPPSPFRRRR